MGAEQSTPVAADHQADGKASEGDAGSGGQEAKREPKALVVVGPSGESNMMMMIRVAGLCFPFSPEHQRSMLPRSR